MNDIVDHARTIVLTRASFYAERTVPRHVFEDWITRNDPTRADDLVVGLRADLYAAPLPMRIERRTETVERVPSSWWQHLRQALGLSFKTREITWTFASEYHTWTPWVVGPADRGKHRVIFGLNPAKSPWDHFATSPDEIVP